MKLPRFVLAIGIALMAQMLGGQSKSGLLLTTAASSEEGQRFHAYWITRDGEQVHVMEGERLLILRGSGWWEVGTTALKRATTQTSSEAVWAGPVGSPKRRTRVIAFTPEEPCADDINTYSVSWAGADFATLQHAYANTCGKNSVVGAQSYVVRLDELRNEEQQSRAHIPLRDVAGRAGESAMTLGAEIAKGRTTGQHEIAPDESSWIVVRSKGRYRLLGVTAQDGAQDAGGYDIPVDPPRSLVGTNEMAVHWDSVLDKSPDALDAYTSPDASFLVIVKPHRLAMYEVSAGKIGRELSHVALASPSVVAAQWANSAEVESWSDSLRALMKSPFQKK